MPISYRFGRATKHIRKKKPTTDGKSSLGAELPEQPQYQQNLALANQSLPNSTERFHSPAGRGTSQASSATLTFERPLVHGSDSSQSNHTIPRKPLPALGELRDVDDPRNTARLDVMDRKHSNHVSGRASSRSRNDAAGNGRNRSATTATNRLGVASAGPPAPSQAHRIHRSELFSWMDHISQSADDRTIHDNVQQIFARAGIYIENFFTDRPWQQARPDYHFDNMEFDIPPGHTSIQALLHYAEHPTTIIKHCLVSILLSAISFDCSGPFPSLLPIEFTTMAEALRNAKVTDSKIPQFTEALSTHRILSFYIRQAVNDDGFYTALRDKAIEQIATSFLTVFDPWVNASRSSDQRVRALHDLLEKTAALGILLFSQPSTFLFHWHMKPSVIEDEIDVAISPRLFKICDEHAQRLGEAQLIVSLKSEKTYILRPSSQSNSASDVYAPLHPNRGQLLPLVIENSRQEPLSRNGWEPGLVELDSIDASQNTTFGTSVVDRELGMCVPELHGESHYQTQLINRPRSFGMLAPNEQVLNQLVVQPNGATQKLETAYTSSRLPLKKTVDNDYRQAPAVRSQSQQDSSVSEIAQSQIYQEPRGDYAVTSSSSRQLNQPSSGPPVPRKDPPNSFPANFGNSGIVRSGSFDRPSRNDVPSQHGRRRSRSATGTRSSTWSPDHSDGGEIRFVETDPQGLGMTQARTSPENDDQRSQTKGTLVILHPQRADYYERNSQTQEHLQTDRPGSRRGQPGQHHLNETLRKHNESEKKSMRDMFKKPFSKIMEKKSYHQPVLN